jgi:hypothetical protein
MAKKSTKQEPEKRGAGQPALPPELKRLNFVIRINSVERLKLEKLAKKAGLGVATYVRQKALGDI